MYKQFPFCCFVGLLLLLHLPMAAQSGVDRDWWRQFSDPLLDSLIQMGVERNYDLKISAQRMAVARATMNQAKAGWYPTVGVSVGWTAERSSGATTRNEVSTPTDRYFNAGLNASWEVDLFGKVATAVKAKRAEFQASQAEYAGNLVAIAAQIASTYFTLRSQQRLLQVAQAHCASQMRIVEIAKARYQADLASKLDVAEAYQTYYSTAATIPSLENSVVTSINALGVLVGELPEEAAAMLNEPGPLPNWSSRVAAGIPADVVRQRPDVIQAQQSLEAAAQQVGIARKDFLPTLTIEGTVGTAARDVGKLFSGKSWDWSVTPTLSWTLFDGFSRKYQLVSAKESWQSALDSYNLVVLNAISEVANDLSSYNAKLKQIAILEQLCAQNEEALQLSIERYKDSLSPMTDVVNAQLNALSGESQLVQAQASALNALVTLYEALGGGITPDF
jgi:NodT family efflux transporter outer membrane factor (OMF) lipoprotein